MNSWTGARIEGGVPETILKKKISKQEDLDDW